jgi:hypothetical protein
MWSIVTSEISGCGGDIDNETFTCDEWHVNRSLGVPTVKVRKWSVWTADDKGNFGWHPRSGTKLIPVTSIVSMTKDKSDG